MNLVGDNSFITVILPNLVRNLAIINLEGIGCYPIKALDALSLSINATQVTHPIIMLSSLPEHKIRYFCFSICVMNFPLPFHLVSLIAICTSQILL